MTCAHGLRVLPDVAWSDVDGLDVFVLPGGNSSVQLGDDAFISRVRRLADSGTLMTSVCTGALVYAKAGLLDGRPATTHWGSLEALASYGEGIEVQPDARFVDDGDVITAAGVSAGIDMALHLVGRLDSEDRAREVQRCIQYEARSAQDQSAADSGRAKEILERRRSRWPKASKHGRRSTV